MISEELKRLRREINENLRVQRGGAAPVQYIDVSNSLTDVSACQNHAVFGRRGCGKTLLLHYSASTLPADIRPVYLNCEDFKKHSFPNVLIEILDALFKELESKLTGWFGRKKRSRDLIAQIRKELNDLKTKADSQAAEIHSKEQRETKQVKKHSINLQVAKQGLKLADELGGTSSSSLERKYSESVSKIRDLDMWLPTLKNRIREFFDLSTGVRAVFLQIDDFYHLSREDQPLVMDYIHRLCKDLPLYFKIATLRHASTLYADRKGQPLGAQERHDYQPIDVDFTFSNFKRTVEQNRQIFEEFGIRAKMGEGGIQQLFKGEGFGRLVMAGGGVPRDCLSLFLELLDTVQPPAGDGKIGKDDVRISSRSNFERRIEELKQDSEGKEQSILIRGIYVLREFCVAKKSNVLLVSEALLQQNDQIRNLLYRLLDYRIIHSAGSALTHKSQTGSTYHAFVIDIGCYAHMRKLDNRFNEIDVSRPDAKEKMRSGSILEKEEFGSLWDSSSGSEGDLLAQEGEDN